MLEWIYEEVVIAFRHRITYLIGKLILIMITFGYVRVGNACSGKCVVSDNTAKVVGAVTSLVTAIAIVVATFAT